MILKILEINYFLNIKFKWENKVLLRYSIQTYNSDKELEKLLYAVKKLLN